MGGGDFSCITPIEAPKLEISMAGAYGVYFDETAIIRNFKMNIAGSGNLVCKDLRSDRVNLNVAGSGMMKCKHLISDDAHLSVADSGSVVIETGSVKSADVSVAGSGSVETRCQIESMDYSIAGTGRINYYGDVKVKGYLMGGKINRIDSENAKTKKKCCDEKQK